jgi:chromatin remodeling complex protein RSC6
MPPSKKNSSLKTSTKKKKTVSTLEPKPLPNTVPEVEPTTPTTPKVDEDKQNILDYSSEFATLTSALSDALSVIKNLTLNVKKLEKQIAKDKKIIDKELKKKKNVKKTNRVLNGFSKPGNVSDELKNFFDLGSDEKIARTEVTKKITSYCLKHKLQNEKDKRIIKPNKDLKKLLRLGDNEELTYFNLQKYMKIHFPNKEGIYINL